MTARRIVPLLIVLVLAAVSCGPASPRPTATLRYNVDVTPRTPVSVTATAVTWLTLDGYDPQAGITVQAINLWNDHADRGAGIAGTGRHGERVQLVRRAGEGVLVKLPDGTRGWVTYYFIREYK